MNGVGGRRGRKRRRAAERALEASLCGAPLRRVGKGALHHDTSGRRLGSIILWLPRGFFDAVTDPPLGYCERRRRAKLRRRARDRDVARILAEHENIPQRRGTERLFGEPLTGIGGIHGSRGHGARFEAAWYAFNGGVCVDGPWPPAAWWSTPEGRRRWTEENRVHKRARRAACDCMRKLGTSGSPAVQAAAETFVRIMAEDAS